MNTIITKNLFWIINYITLLVSSFFYSYFVNISTKFQNNFVTIGYILILLAVFFVCFSKVKKEAEAAIDIRSYLPFILLMYLGVYLGVYLSGAHESVIWMPDSYRVHLPQSILFMRGDNILRIPQHVDERFLFFHMITGVFFLFFGVNIYAGGAVLFIGKILSAFVIFILGARIFDKKVGIIALLIYSFMPTVLFHSIVFYKEVYVHLFVALIYYFSYRVLFEYQNKFLLPLLISLLLLFNERFYLASFFVITLFGLLLLSPKIPKKYRITLLSILSIFGLYIFYLFFYDITHLASWRRSYNGYPDINKKWNTEIPYLLAFIKILFTPFFTFNKFDLYDKFAYLGIWGTFFNQIIISLMLGGLYKRIKKDILLNFLIFFPLFCFLLLFAYVGPAHGRLRDSFLPVISIYAAYAAFFLFKRKKES